MRPTDLPPDLRAAVETSWRSAVRAHRSMALPFDDFLSDILMLWTRGRARQSLPADVPAFREDAPRLQYDDLLLARLCERGDGEAWRAFAARYEPDLRGVLQRHVDADAAEQVATSVLSDVALPPKRKPDRTMLGTYEGSGPLWAWLATIGIRRVRRKWRRREAPLEAAGEPSAPAPVPSAEMDAEATQFLQALQAAWATLEPREALAVAWKHGDGLSQRDVARLLGTSEPTVSRIINRAITKIRGAIATGLPTLSPETDGTWTRLEAILSIHFERLRAQRHEKTEES